ncbi:hypothetical protein GGP57_002705 [Salinibacter ruber]|uniref:hypothetical protein n=1 Tax=Salinibacter ruber TaxID=146919 RepID=UPI0021673455|nr:hypothetical protein [Salinibacter ruber]MCS3635370.1 hypothetical protein [Salinibacter ruber]MCS3714860.1 hypothetical protein [Salinibacter ruber]
MVLVPAYHCRLGPSVHRSVGTSSATLVLISGRGAMAYVVLGREEAGRLVGGRLEIEARLEGATTAAS